MAKLTPKIVPGDWNAVAHAIAKLDIELNTGATPTFAGVTLSGLTASRLMATDVSKVLASVADLTTWITGTANQVVVADDGDGTITLSLPQDIHTGAVPTFSGLIPATNDTYDLGKEESISGGLEISQEVYGGLNLNIGLTSWGGNSFTTIAAFNLEKITLRLQRISSPPNNTTVDIYATTAGKPSGSSLGSKTVDTGAITTDSEGELVDFEFSSAIALSETTMYAFAVKVDNNDEIRLVGSNSDEYAGGTHLYTSDSGSSWGITVGWEHVFYLYSQSAIVYTRWQDLYLSGVLHDGTDSLSVANAKAAYDFTTALNAATDGQLMIGSTGANPVLATLTGTTNQITVTGDAGSITLSTPQDIHAAASPTFASLSLGTGELTAGSINRAADTLTLEIAGTPELSISADLVAIANGLTVDTDTLVVDKANTSVVIGGTTGSQALDIVSGSIELVNTTTSTTGVIYKGTDRFIHNFQHPTGGGAVPRGNNLFIGVRAGNFLMGGTATETWHASNNSAIGEVSLYNNTTGYSNLAMGYASLYSNTTGHNNLAMGSVAGYYNQTGRYNVIMGASAGGFGASSVNSFSSNIFLGYQSGYNITTGSSNIFLGRGSGYRQTNASDLLIMDNQTRGSVANEQTQSLIYGLFDANPANQTLRINGEILGSVGAKIGDGGTTNYMEITATGGVVFAGGAGLAFAEINVVSNAVETAIASTGAAVQITIFNTNGPANNVTPDHTNDHITITKAGIYLITVSSTVNSVTGAASRLEMTVLKNNGAALVGALHCDRDVGGGGSESGSVSISGLADLSVDDTIEVWIENETNTQNYIVEDITLTLVQVGGN